MAATPRLSLPFLSVGQAQKEFTHNEALQTLDLLVCGAIEEPPRATPPTSTSIGACYIAGSGATGAWSGKGDCLAAWTAGGWRFVSPFEGLSVHERMTGSRATFRNGSWQTGIVAASSIQIDGQQVVGSREAAIESPAGGSVVDVEARAAVNAILNTLRQHGLIAL